MDKGKGELIIPHRMNAHELMMAVYFTLVNYTIIGFISICNKDTEEMDDA